MFSLDTVMLRFGKHVFTVGGFVIFLLWVIKYCGSYQGKSIGTVACVIINSAQRDLAEELGKVASTYISFPVFLGVR